MFRDNQANHLLNRWRFENSLFNCWWETDFVKLGWV